MSDADESTGGRVSWRIILVLLAVVGVVLLGVTEFLAENDSGSRLISQTIATVAPPRARAQSGRDGDWSHYRDHAERALAAGDVNRALRAWHDGYPLALSSREWQPMAEMGDLYLRIGRVTDGLLSARPTVRRAYLTALVRARRDRSIEGMLRAGEGFMRLGDEEMSRVCLVLAGQIAPEVGYGSSVKPDPRESQK
jgi:hypothetical protein